MFTKSGRLLMLNNAFMTIGVHPDRRIRLASNVPAGSPDDGVEGEFTEATFPGYAEIVNPAFAAAALDGLDRGKIFTPTLTWTGGAVVTPETIKSIYVVYTSADPNVDGLVFWQELPAWVTISNPGEQVNQVVTFYDRDFAP